jgi:protein phosphatase
VEITPEPTSTPVKQPSRGRSLVVMGGLLLVLGSATLGLLLWWQLQPQAFQQMCRQLPSGIQQLCSPSSDRN